MLVLQELVFWCCVRWSLRPTDQGQCKNRQKSGHKKTARLRWRFFGKLGFYKNDSPLSIRQRLEMPKKVKIKLGGHDGFGRLELVKRLAL
ncbi:hypothetical protein [Caballeronia mineralivorans]|uniref:hypothetical protein n=1 Tax=Caballeronia mineralivorans TaxID=2010198 RepID=UPI001364D3BA|nr:hypothetical protein [Caballeronia mineralivorans]